jgi:putative hemolysin
VQREDGSWLLDGLLSVEDFVDLFELDNRADEVRGPYQTIGGFVVSRLGTLPKVTDRVAWADYVFEVVDLDGNRIDKILLSRVDATTADATPDP